MDGIDGVITNGTERSMYRLLHHAVDEWRNSYQFIHSRTKYARAALERWVNTGVLETAQVPYSPHSTTTYTAYRLAPRWRDADLVADNLAAREQELAGRAAMAAQRLEKSGQGLNEAWDGLRALVNGIDRVADEDIEQVLDAVSAAQRALIRRSSALSEHSSARELAGRLEQERIALVEQALVTTGAGNGDPLGGDA